MMGTQPQYRRPRLPGIRYVVIPVVVLLTYAYRGAFREPFSAAEAPSIDKDTSAVAALPRSLGLAPFYRKYLDAAGIPVVGSVRVPAKALVQARDIVLHMTSKRPDVREKMADNQLRVAVMAAGEVTTDIPEHSDLNEAFPQTNWNTRARGLGPTLVRPAVSCAEENLLCYPQDPYRGEDILVHEFAHAMHVMGIRYVDPAFDAELATVYQAARASGSWNNTYAMSNKEEYWAEGVQCWFDVNQEAVPSNGIHNQINTRAELKKYDAGLYGLIGRYFLASDGRISCQ